MLDLIKDVSPLQLLLMCVGLLFIVFSFKDDIISLFKSIKLPKKDDDIDLTKIVSKWEDLSDSCRDANLIDAYDKLQEVFPLLVEVRDEEES
jgi:hypothetical protein